jgi:hypothetical protein
MLRLSDGLTEVAQNHFPCSARTHPVKTPDMVVDSAGSIMMGERYAAAFCWRARFQLQGRSSSIRLAG